MTKVAFIKRGLFSHTNTRVLEQLDKQFPEYEIVVIDVVADILRKKPLLVGANLPSLVRMHGPSILLDRRRIEHFFYQTPFLFHTLRREIRALLEPLRPLLAFTFQTQALFDASLPGLPHFLYTDHTHLANLYYPTFDRSTLLPTAWTDLEKEIYLHATLNLTMSTHVGRSMREHYGVPPNRLACVYAGSNTSSTPLPLENDDFQNQNILFVGVDWERKGGPILVRAFERVRRKFPRASLTIVGSSPPISVENCRILGRLPLEEVRRQYARASVFCLPTRVEPFGIAPLEAFLQKIPVVGTAIGALPDFIDDGVSGRLIPPDDSEALAEALEELLQDPARCRMMGETGHAQIARRYNWDAVGQRMHEFMTPHFRSGK